MFLSERLITVSALIGSRRRFVISMSSPHCFERRFPLIWRVEELRLERFYLVHSKCSVILRTVPFGVRTAHTFHHLHQFQVNPLLCIHFQRNCWIQIGGETGRSWDFQRKLLITLNLIFFDFVDCQLTVPSSLFKSSKLISLDNILLTLNSISHLQF